MPLAPPAADPAHRRSRLRLAAFVAGAALLVAACSSDAATTARPTDTTALEPVATAADSPADPPADPPVDSPVDSRVDSPVDPPVDPSVVAETESPVDLLQPEGFTTTVVRITEVDGDVCEVCMWLADTAEERSRGLMGVTDLGEAAGMLFVFGSSGTRSFYMFETPAPLSIAWFAEGGAYVDSTDMSPCLDVPAADCARYAPDVPYLMAIEVFEGGLDDLGIGPGALIDVLPEDCDSPPS